MPNYRTLPFWSKQNLLLAAEEAGFDLASSQHVHSRYGIGEFRSVVYVDDLLREVYDAELGADRGLLGPMDEFDAIEAFLNAYKKALPLFTRPLKR